MKPVWFVDFCGP